MGGGGGVKAGQREHEVPGHTGSVVRKEQREMGAGTQLPFPFNCVPPRLNPWAGSVLSENLWRTYTCIEMAGAS